MENIDVQARRTAINQLVQAMKRGVGREENYRIFGDGGEGQYDKDALRDDDKENFEQVRKILAEDIPFEKKCEKIFQQQLYLDDLDVLDMEFGCQIFQASDAEYIPTLTGLGIEIAPKFSQYEQSGFFGVAFGENGGQIEEIPEAVLYDEGFMAGFLNSYADSFVTWKDYLDKEGFGEDQRIETAQCVRIAFDPKNVALRQEGDKRRNRVPEYVQETVLTME